MFCHTTLVGLLYFSPSRLKSALDPKDDWDLFLRGARPSYTPGREEERAFKAGEGGTEVDNSEYEEEKLLIDEAYEVESVDIPESLLTRLGRVMSELDFLEADVEVGPKKGDLGWSEGSSIKFRSTLCNSLIRRAIQRDILGWRISSLYKARLSKYSSTLPFVNVPSIAGPMP